MKKTADSECLKASSIYRTSPASCVRQAPCLSENKQGCSFAIVDPIKSDYIFRRGAALHLPFLPPARIQTAGRAREYWWRPLSIRNDFGGWFYPPTFLISATRPPWYRGNASPLRIKGWASRGLTLGSYRREIERRMRGVKKGGKERDRRGRIDKKGCGIERVSSSRCLFFTSRKSHTRAAPDAHPIRSPIPKFNKYGVE